MVVYYRNLASIFWNSKMHLFHAVALYNYYAHARRQNGIQIDQKQLVSEVVLSAISIPSRCIEYQMPKK